MSGLSARVARRVHAGLVVDVELEVAPGETVVVFGPSGAGKSTLLGLIAGLTRPDAGRIVLGGETLFDADGRVDAPLRRRRLGVIYQDDRLFPHLDVASNIGYGLRGLPAAERMRRVAELAATCGVEGLMGRRVAGLSGGERQRVGLARAVAPRPRLLLCDEPLSALDAASRWALLEALETLQAREGFPILYVTHGVAEAVAVGDRLLRLEAGRVADRGGPLEVLARAGLPGPAWDDPIENRFHGEVSAIEPGGRDCRVRIGGVGGPEIVVPHDGEPVGAGLAVGIRSTEIVLARLDAGEAAARLSARNVVTGRVSAVAEHDGAAEVSVEAGATRWTVSVSDGAVQRLALTPGVEVLLIFKARGVSRLGRGAAGPEG